MEPERPRSRWYPDDGPPPPHGYAVMGPTGRAFWPSLVLIVVCVALVVAALRWL